MPALVLVPGAVANGEYAALVALLFPAVGIGLAVWAASAWLKMRRFKSATLVLSSTPVALGDRLRGAIRIDSRVPARKDFQIDLTCIERVRRRTSKGSQTSERIVWQNRWTIARERCQLMDSYSSIPLDLPVPHDLPASGTVQDDDRIEWRLEAAADCPGPDFWARFELPVFAVDARAGVPTLDEALGTNVDDAPPRDAAAPRDAAPTSAELAALGIVYERLPQGGELWTFKRARHKTVALTLTLITAVFGAAAVVLFLTDAPLILAVAFAGFDTLFILFALHLWFAEYRVTLDDRVFTVARKGALGAAKVVEIPRAWVKAVRAQRGMEAGNKLYYDLKVETADGRLTAASALGDYTVATWLAGHWMTAGNERA